jgi:hypothetical protein
VTRRTSGSIAPGRSDDVTVEMDASELTPGTYQANVCVGSDDPERPILAVPVRLTVAVSLPVQLRDRAHACFRARSSTAGEGRL